MRLGSGWGGSPVVVNLPRIGSLVGWAAAGTESAGTARKPDASVPTGTSSCGTESSCASNESRTEGDTGPAPKTLQRCQVFQRSEPSSSSLLLQNSLHPCQTIPNPGFHRAQWNLLTLRNLAIRQTGIKPILIVDAGGLGRSDTVNNPPARDRHKPTLVRPRIEAPSATQISPF